LNRAICTIVTKDYIPWALSLRDSLVIWEPNVIIETLVVDDESEYIRDFNSLKNINFYSLSELQSESKEFRSHDKSDLSKLRWLTKSSFLLYLYRISHYNKIIYIDGDIHFYNDHTFLWDELTDNRLLLTPHWISIKPSDDIFLIHNSGLYNAGFLGTTRDSIEIIEWWKKICEFKCVSHPKYFNYDQGYLDVIPVYFEGVKVLKHKGCNVAYWNSNHLSRYVKDGVGYVGDGVSEFPIVFYHFGRNKFDHFIEGSDKQIRQFLELLNSRLHSYGYKQDLLSLGTQQLINRSIPKTIKNRMMSFLRDKLPFEIQKKINN